MCRLMSVDYFLPAALQVIGMSLRLAEQPVGLFVADDPFADRHPSRVCGRACRTDWPGCTAWPCGGRSRYRRLAGSRGSLIALNQSAMWFMLKSSGYSLVRYGS